MDGKQKSFCCDHKTTTVLKDESDISKYGCKSAQVELLRIEDDSELLVWINNNLKCDVDFKKLKQNKYKRPYHKVNAKNKGIIYVNYKNNFIKCNEKINKMGTGKVKTQISSINKNKGNTLLKTQKPDIKKTIKTVPSKNNKIQLSSTSKTKLNQKTNQANTASKPDGAKETQEIDNTNEDEILVTVTLEEEKTVNGCVSSITNISFDYHEESSTVPQSANKEEGIDQVSIRVDQFKSSSNLDTLVGSPNRPTNASQKGISYGVCESSSLISELTGCDVPPHEVRLLSMPDSGIDGNEKPSSHHVDSDLLENNLTHSSAVSAVQKHYNQDNLENTPVRTVYDLMNEISAILPSWNLHILPDTNTFCIGQLTRNRAGFPHLSKCIELDDGFNAKVYIYQEHCKKYDGVYPSEDAIASLIHEVDSYEL